MDFRHNTVMENQEIIIGLDSERLGYGKVILSNPYRIAIRKGITVVCGDNGSGKTTFGTIIEKGRYAYGNRISFSENVKRVKMLSFTDIHSLSGMEAQYFSQRMESTMNDMVPSVTEIMNDKIHSCRWNEYCSFLGLEDVADKKINYLSSGELRKLLIINALLDDPNLIILDNPYIGLDTESRDELDRTLVCLRQQDISIIMLICDPKDIPSFTDELIEISDKTISNPISDKGRIDRIRNNPENDTFDADAIPPQKKNPLPHSISFEIRNGRIKYGSRDILKDFNWKVAKGEKWVLTGPNGSGKSLLLSLICADNPQGYANDITLFDRKRGSGESIWEIKDEIGYVSPEMQLFFKSNSSVKEIIIQGMRNSLNRYHPATQEEFSESDLWMDLLGISALADRKFHELSSGEQRLVLVARAMIKQPALLVLDEPLHGLDAKTKRRINAIVKGLAERNDMSLIYVTHYDNEIPDCITKRKALVKMATSRSDEDFLT